MTDTLLRRPDVENLTGLSRSSIYRLMEEETFPRPLRIGRRAVAWPATDVQRWIEARSIADPSKTP